MKCQKCGGNFLENEIEESHDVPCYLFDGFNRRERKNQADKFSRHWLCRKCHNEYEEVLKDIFKIRAIEFSYKFFKESKK